MKGNQVYHLWSCIIEYEWKLIQTYVEHELEKAKQEWQDIETIWEFHHTAFIEGEYTKLNFLWMPFEEELIRAC